MMYFNFIGNIEFASRWKKALSPDSVAQGKLTGQMLAQNKSDVAKGIYTQAQTRKDLASGVEKGKSLAATGKQNLYRKATTKRLKDLADKKFNQGKYAVPFAPAPATSSWTPPKPKSSIPNSSMGDAAKQAIGSKSGMADDIAKGVSRGMLKKKLLIGSGIAAAGIGLNALRKARQRKQQSPFKKLFN